MLIHHIFCLIIDNPSKIIQQAVRHVPDAGFEGGFNNFTAALRHRHGAISLRLPATTNGEVQRAKGVEIEEGHAPGPRKVVGCLSKPAAGSL